MVIHPWLVGRRTLKENKHHRGKLTFVLGPALAIERIPGPVCLWIKFSSSTTLYVVHVRKKNRVDTVGVNTYIFRRRSNLHGKEIEIKEG